MNRLIFLPLLCMASVAYAVSLDFSSGTYSGSTNDVYTEDDFSFRARGGGQSGFVSGPNPVDHDRLIWNEGNQHFHENCIIMEHVQRQIFTVQRFTISEATIRTGSSSMVLTATREDGSTIEQTIIIRGTPQVIEFSQLNQFNNTTKFKRLKFNLSGGPSNSLHNIVHIDDMELDLVPAAPAPGPGPVPPVPEPVTLLLLGLAGSGLAVAGHRRRGSPAA